MKFLDENYKEPTDSDYMNFEKGENRFRILSPAIYGSEYWKTYTKEDGTEGRKPVRVKPGTQIQVGDLGVDKWGNPETPKVFWAFLVYNFNAEKIQVLSTVTKSVREGIKSYTINSKWGDPSKYTFAVTKTGEGMETRYSVIAEPKEDLDSGILKQLKSLKYDLDLLYEGGHPLKAEQDDSEPSSEVEEPTSEEVADQIPF